MALSVGMALAVGLALGLAVAVFVWWTARAQATSLVTAERGLLDTEKALLEERRAAAEQHLPRIDELEQAQRNRDSRIQGLQAESSAHQMLAHIVRRAQKSYWDQFTSAPESAVLFLPGERPEITRQFRQQVAGYRLQVWGQLLHI